MAQRSPYSIAPLQYVPLDRPQNLVPWEAIFGLGDVLNKRAATTEQNRSDADELFGEIKQNTLEFEQPFVEGEYQKILKPVEAALQEANYNPADPRVVNATAKAKRDIAANDVFRTKKANFEAYKAQVKAMDELEKKNQLGDFQKSLFDQELNSYVQGASPTSTINFTAPFEAQDIPKYLDEQLKFYADSQGWKRDDISGDYYVLNGSTKEFVSRDKVAKAMVELLDSQLQGGPLQRQLQMAGNFYRSNPQAIASSPQNQALVQYFQAVEEAQIEAQTGKGPRYNQAVDRANQIRENLGMTDEEIGVRASWLDTYSKLNQAQQAGDQETVNKLLPQLEYLNALNYGLDQGANVLTRKPYTKTTQEYRRRLNEVGAKRATMEVEQQLASVYDPGVVTPTNIEKTASGLMEITNNVLKGIKVDVPDIAGGALSSKEVEAEIRRRQGLHTKAPIGRDMAQKDFQKDYIEVNGQWYRKKQSDNPDDVYNAMQTSGQVDKLLAFGNANNLVPANFNSMPNEQRLQVLTDVSRNMNEYVKNSALSTTNDDDVYAVNGNLGKTGFGASAITNLLNSSTMLLWDKSSGKQERVSFNEAAERLGMSVPELRKEIQNAQNFKVSTGLHQEDGASFTYGFAYGNTVLYGEDNQTIREKYEPVHNAAKLARFSVTDTPLYLYTDEDGNSVYGQVNSKTLSGEAGTLDKNGNFIPMETFNPSEFGHIGGALRTNLLRLNPGTRVLETAYGIKRVPVPNR